MDRLKDKVAVITGGNSGIGLATAQEFIAQGAKVVITGRNAKTVSEVAKSLGSAATGIVSDVQNMADVRSLADKVRAHHARVDILFVNAGISLGAPIDLVDEAHFDSQFDINVKGAYFTIQQLLPLLSDGASIILNASAVTHRGFAGLSVYTATKSALTGLARALSTEFLDRKIRVNTISPGPIETPIFDKMGVTAEGKDGFRQLVPMKRFGKPEEIAAVATFLASADSSFVIGQDIVAGGGVGTL
jgi:NAD(P)-dependent dehydrogenase (short-subunit alcohol dehydrogenase family)